GHQPATPPVAVRLAAEVAGTADAGREPGVAVDAEPRPQAQQTGAGALLGRRDHTALLDDLEGVDREDRLGRRLDLDAAAVARQADRVADHPPLHGEAEDRPAAVDGPPGAQVGAPGVVAELLIGRDVD